MENHSNNPLFKHFRQPAIYLKLPSQGRFYPEGTIELSVTNDIPIYPMTVKDEITLKTPDALLNGAGMAEIVKSCCPSIKDPWVIPAVDLDAIFVAIRLASYGQGMDITTTCPHCNETNENTVNLTNILDNIKPADYTEPATIDNLVFKFKPQSYKDINLMNIVTFEERKLVNNIMDSDIDEAEKKRLFDISFKKITDLNVDLLISCIESITVDGNAVTDADMIRDFLNNCSRQSYTAIKDKIQDLVNKNKLDDMNLTCSECTKEYATALEFDQANFFE